MKWLDIGFRIVPLIVGAITAVEKLFEKRDGESKAEKSRRKQEAAVETVGAMLAALEAGLAKDLLDDADVRAAVRSVIDAYVKLQNVIAQVRTAPDPTP
mgnify:CR=1 FL=1